MCLAAFFSVAEGRGSGGEGRGSGEEWYKLLEAVGGGSIRILGLGIRSTLVLAGGAEDEATGVGALFCMCRTTVLHVWGLGFRFSPVFFFLLRAGVGGPRDAMDASPPKP